MKAVDALRERFGALQDLVRSQLWPLPVLGVVVAVVLGLVVPIIDRHVDPSLGGGFGWLFGGDASAAQTVLDAVSSSLITVTSLTFSLTVVTLQLASSQFSPRLLRTFTSDVFVQATLGLFLATFTFSLVVLRGVRSTGNDQIEVVPRFAVTLSVVLGVASVVGLVVFLAHLAQQIRVETMLRDVHGDAERLLTNHGPQDPDPTTPWSMPARELPTPPPTARRLLAPSSGFLVRVDRAKLLSVCTQLDLVCILERPIGSSLVEGTPVGWLWAGSAPPHSGLDPRLAKALRVSLKTSFERTSLQDVGYGLRQLTDVANKALSPGINDPTTAVHTLGHISALLCQLARVDLDPLVSHDDDGVLRVVVHQPRFADLVETAIDQPRRYGASDPQLLDRLLQLLAELAWRCRPDQREIVRGQLARTRAVVAAQDYDDTELAELERAASQVDRALAADRATDLDPDADAGHDDIQEAS